MDFLTPLFEKAKRQQITHDDLPRPGGFNSTMAHDRLQAALERTTWTKYRLILALLDVVKWDILFLAVLEIASECTTYARPFVLSLFLKSLQEYIAGKGPIYRAFYFAIMLCAVPLVSNALSNITLLYSNLVYIGCRSSLTGVIYQKSLNLHPKSRNEYNSAKIMNMISVDTNQIDSLGSIIPTIVSAPVAMVIATWQLYVFIGPTMLVSIPVYLFFTVFSGWATKQVCIFMPKLMGLRDKRNKATTEAVRNIKSLKLYTWEAPFKQKILDIRDDELAVDTAYMRIFALMTSLWSCIGDVVAAGVFVACLYFQKGTLGPETVFPVLALLAYITTPFMQLPTAVTSLGQAINSQQRINELLVQPEIDHKNYARMPAVNGYSKAAIDFENATCSWSGDEDVVLENISFKAGNGDLVCITGKVGAGKTALVKALISEIVIVKGEVTVRGSISYCSQEPWLQNMSIKENILFGKRLEPEFYRATLEACALDVDIAALADKDDTQVGERGVSLSGGQKARVALARAIYARSDVIVLDDVLSAVDEHVSSHLIERVLGSDGLLASKTIVLATNNVKVLAHASKVIVLESKKISEVSDGPRTLSRAELLQRPSPSPPTEEDTPRRSSDEETDTASVSLGVFKRYLVSAGPLVLVLVLVSVLLVNLIAIWLGVISNHRFESLPEARYYIAVYVFLAVFGGLSIFFSQFWFMCSVAIRVSRRIHQEMLDAVMASPMRFFDTNPVGKVVNRFSGDIVKLDTAMPIMLYSFVRSGMNLAVQLVTVVIGAPFIVIVIVPLVFLGNSYRELYIPASRQLQRMSAAANSPILSHIEESIKGAAVVRAFDCVRQFVRVYESHTDYWMDVNFVSRNFRRWLAWRIQGMSAVLDFGTGLSLVVLVYYGWLSAGVVGVVMYNASRAGLMVQQIITRWAELEVTGVALERIYEYVDLPTETERHPCSLIPPQSWPEQGQVCFKNFSARYLPEGEDVLKQITFSIASHEKIGIVGRTGAGKSTITLSLFSIVEATSGNIDIDGANTSKIGLGQLRSALSIIPQDSQIFGGTLRENLDPLKGVCDSRLWEVLGMCSLKQHFEDLGTGLDTMLSDGGDNLSRGQGQLICLARALLRDSTILVLDEATASVDVETDKVVQQAIRAQFKDRTIVTIAHRLDTIMDSDRILVLDSGRVVEYDSPSKLLKSKGALYRLVEAAKNKESIE